MMTELWL